MYVGNNRELSFFLNKFGVWNKTTKTYSIKALLPTTSTTHIDSVVMNNTSSPTVLQTSLHPSFLHVLIVAMLICILFIGFFGNFLVIYIFGAKPIKKSKAKRFEAFLTILAAVDFVSSLFVPTTFIYLTITNYQRWDFGYVGCKVIPPLLQITISFSQGVLILINYERYQSIVHPFDRRLTDGKIYAWLTFVCLVSIVLAIPYTLTLDLVDRPTFNVKTCLPRSDSQSLQLLSSCIYLVRDASSIAVMFYLYVRMNHHLTKDYVTVTWDRASFSRKGRRLLRTVVIVFIILTLPFDVFQVTVLAVFVNDDKDAITPSIYEKLLLANTLLQILQISNSVSNIFIYSRLHSKFRVLIKCCRQKNDKDDCSVDRRSLVTIDNYRISVRFTDGTDECSSCTSL